MHTYPFPSKNKKDYKKMREGQDYAVWIKPGTDVNEIVSRIPGPIVEIGGPTASGYYFLDQMPLPSKPVITNITATPVAMYDEDAASYVDEVVDGRRMPYGDESIGMFLMSGVSITSDWYMDLPDEERDKLDGQIDKEYDVAVLEMEQVAIGATDPSDVKYAQRVPIYQEVCRALKSGGLFMTNTALEEVIILQRMGLEIIAFAQERLRPEHNWDGIYYEIVAQKK